MPDLDQDVAITILGRDDAFAIDTFRSEQSFLMSAFFRHGPVGAVCVICRVIAVLVSLVKLHKFAIFIGVILVTVRPIIVIAVECGYNLNQIPIAVITHVFNRCMPQTAFLPLRHFAIASVSCVCVLLPILIVKGDFSALIVVGVIHIAGEFVLASQILNEFYRNQKVAIINMLSSEERLVLPIVIGPRFIDNNGLTIVVVRGVDHPKSTSTCVRMMSDDHACVVVSVGVHRGVVFIEPFIWPLVANHDAFNLQDGKARTVIINGDLVIYFFGAPCQ